MRYCLPDQDRPCHDPHPNYALKSDGRGKSAENRDLLLQGNMSEFSEKPLVTNLTPCPDLSPWFLTFSETPPLFAQVPPNQARMAFWQAAPTLPARQPTPRLHHKTLPHNTLQLIKQTSNEKLNRRFFGTQCARLT
jgi:hypothetical protein